MTQRKVILPHAATVTHRINQRTTRTCAQGFWFTEDLDWLARTLDELDTKYFVLSWNSTFGVEYYSIITCVHHHKACLPVVIIGPNHLLHRYIPGTQVVFEFMGEKPDGSYISEGVVHRTDIQRLSDYGIMATPNITRRTTPIKISRATSNLTRDREEYTAIKAGTVGHYTSGNDMAMGAFKWPTDGYTEIQFWERPDSQTLGDFTVLSFETKLKEVHDSCLESWKCGFDQR